MWGSSHSTTEKYKADPNAEWVNVFVYLQLWFSNYQGCLKVKR